MFQYKKPQFEKKRLLRIDMLEALRDCPIDYWRLTFLKYSDGIISGCDVSWENDCLTVAPGMVRYKGELYCMTAPCVLECRQEDQMKFLKIRFLNEIRQDGIITGATELLLDCLKPDSDYEIELCRFRLQEGARLRNTYESFQDYSTEYDTINLLHVPYAAENGITLNPALLKDFAKETLRRKTSDPIDLAFCMSVLAAGGHVSPDCIEEYLYKKLEKQADGNEERYQCLLKILKNQCLSESQTTKEKYEKRSVMLL